MLTNRHIAPRPAGAPGRGQPADGRMFWFRRKKFVGSYRSFRATRRRFFSAEPKDSRAFDSCWSLVKLSETPGVVNGAIRSISERVQAMWVSDSAGSVHIEKQ